MFVLAAGEPIFGWVIVGGFIALIVGSIAWSIWHEKKRTEQWRAAAEALGFQFLPATDSLPSSDLSQLALFSKGISRQVSNLLQGATDELRMSIFDYRYTTGSGKSKKTSHQTAIHLESSNLHLLLCFPLPPTTI